MREGKKNLKINLLEKRKRIFNMRIPIGTSVLVCLTHTQRVSSQIWQVTDMKSMLTCHQAM